MRRTVLLATLPPVCLAMPPKAKSIAVPDAEASEPAAKKALTRQLASAKFGELEKGHRHKEQQIGKVERAGGIYCTATHTVIQEQQY